MQVIKRTVSQRGSRSLGLGFQGSKRQARDDTQARSGGEARRVISLKHLLLITYSSKLRSWCGDPTIEEEYDRIELLHCIWPLALLILRYKPHNLLLSHA